MSSLGEFHHAEEAPSKSSKVTSWVVIALIIGAIGIYVVESGMLDSTPTPAGQSFPRGM